MVVLSCFHVKINYFVVLLTLFCRIRLLEHKPRHKPRHNYQTFLFANFSIIAIPCVQMYLWCRIVYMILCCVLICGWWVGVKDVWMLSKVYDIVNGCVMWVNEWMRNMIYLNLKCCLHFLSFRCKVNWTFCGYLTINKIIIIIIIILLHKTLLCFTDC